MPQEFNQIHIALQELYAVKFWSYSRKWGRTAETTLTHPSTHTLPSGVEIHSTQETLFIILHRILLQTRPSSFSLSPLFWLCSRELEYSFDLMEDWHQPRPSVTQDLSVIGIEKHVFIKNKCRNQSGKDTLTFFRIAWCLMCNCKTNLHGYFKNQACLLEVKCRFFSSLPS